MCFGFEGKHHNEFSVAAIANVRELTDEQVREALDKEFSFLGEARQSYVDHYDEAIKKIRAWTRREKAPV